MKTMLRMLMIALVAISTIATATADTFVNGYTRKDGTYVSPHYRSDSNSTVRDNWSYKGNTNPYTGETGGNYYRQSPSSDYYNGSSRSEPALRDSPYYRLRR